MTTFTRVLIVLSISLGLGACHPDDEQSTTTDAGTSVGQPADGGMLVGAAQFHGVWKYESLDARITCADGTDIAVNEVSGTETFTQGSGADQIIGVDDGGGYSVCQVSGNVADCQTDLSASAGDQFSVTVTRDTYTYVNGKLLECSAYRLVDADGFECSVIGTATLSPVK
jgi:hypothetical protein